MNRLLLLALLFISVHSHAQPPIQLSNIFGGSKQDDPRKIIQTYGGGYLIACETYSDDGVFATNYGDFDIGLVRLDRLGKLEWTKTIGGSDYDQITGIAETDRFFIVAGNTESIDHDFPFSGINNYRGFLLWLDKTNGNIVRRKEFNGSNNSSNAIYGFFIQDNKYIIVCGDAYSGTNGILWRAKMDMTGNVLWWKDDENITTQGFGYHVGQYISEVKYPWTGYIMIGSSPSGEPNIIVALDANGDIRWAKPYGRNYENSLVAIHDFYGIDELGNTTMGFIGAGWCTSDSGWTSGNHGAMDAWVLSLDENGDYVSHQCYGGTQNDMFRDAFFTPDGGMMAIGDATPNNVNGNTLLLRTDAFGAPTWQHLYGNSAGAIGFAITSTCDDGYAFLSKGGLPFDGDVRGDSIYGHQDIWFAKLGPDGLDNANCSSWPILSAANTELQQTDITLNPNPAHETVNILIPIDLGQCNISIINTTGVCVQKINKTENKATIDVSRFAPGLYFMNVQSMKGNYSRKFIIE